ncbi:MULTISPECIES: hypothetical protein [unclassified Streptomyces]|uniref:hypothetical protein n=1 Tax=unclassified Streptomyces TaxID=2593676 RepID=UPI0037FEAAD4
MVSGRSTFSVRRARREERHATAFRFNEPVETGSEEDVVRGDLGDLGDLGDDSFEPASAGVVLPR